MNTQPAKVVIVSGGISGIGQAITLLLSKRGWRVVAFGLDAPQLGSTAQNGLHETLEYLRHFYRLSQSEKLGFVAGLR